MTKAGDGGPAVSYNATAFDLLKERKELGCPQAELGETPFICNKGLPACPTGYDCVSDVCTRSSSK